MKTMLLSDLLTMRSSLQQMLAIVLAITIVMAAAMGTLTAALAAVSAMIPFLYLFSVSSIDEQNGWERYRLTLPLSRRQVAFGRSASMLVVTAATVAVAIVFALILSAIAGAIADGQPDSPLAPFTLAENPPASIVACVVLSALVILVGAAVALPLIARFGVTRASRFLPLVVVLILALGIGFAGEGVSSMDFLMFLDVHMTAGDYGAIAIPLAAIAAGSLIIYCASTFLAAKLYEQREF